MTQSRPRDFPEPPQSRRKIHPDRSKKQLLTMFEQPRSDRKNDGFPTHPDIGTRPPKVTFRARKARFGVEFGVVETSMFALFLDSFSTEKGWFSNVPRP